MRLNELIEKHEKTMTWGIASALAFRGEADRAFEWLNKAVQYNDPTVVSTAGYPMLANLHSDPRWLPFLRKIGMAPEQLAAIKFDVKVPKWHGDQRRSVTMPRRRTTEEPHESVALYRHCGSLRHGKHASAA